MRQPYLDYKIHLESLTIPQPPESTLKARELFLQALKRVARDFPDSPAADVLPFLARTVLPLYKEAYEEGQKYFSDLSAQFSIVLKSWLSLKLTIALYGDMGEFLEKELAETGIIWIPKSEFERRDAEHLLRKLVELNSALQEWSATYLMNGDWLYDHALQTINYWCCSDTREEFDWLYRLEYHQPCNASGELFSFEFFPWFPIDEDWKTSYEKRLDEAYETAKHHYHKKMIAYWHVTKKKRRVRFDGTKGYFARDMRRGIMPFIWLVEYQINKLEKMQIARKYNNTHSNIIESLERAADILWISLRPTKRKHSSI
jgi:hypothetical protein